MTDPAASEVLGSQVHPYIVLGVKSGASRVLDTPPTDHPKTKHILGWGNGSMDKVFAM